MVEYSKDNRFPFHTTDRSVAVCMDDHDGRYELEFIYEKLVERHPGLAAEPFYSKVEVIKASRKGDKVAMLKEACDELSRSVRTCLADEDIIHEIHDRWGFGVDKVI